MFVQATGKEFISAVDVGLLGLVHQVELLLQAEATSVGAGLERLVPGEDSPLDLRLQPLVLEGPDIAGQLGGLPLGGVLEGGFVVAISELLGWGSSDPNVLHQRFVLR